MKIKSLSRENYSKKNGKLKSNWIDDRIESGSNNYLIDDEEKNLDFHF